MRLNHIIITQYKNYEYFRLDIREDVVGICGKNGIGKTNLLDAIYYGCFTHSYFSSTDQYCVRQNFDGFRLELEIESDNKTDKIVSVFRSGQKKEMFINDIPYDKFSQHIGKFPVVMIAPDDIELIMEGSETRRKFIDAMISQVDDEYLKQLISYNKLLQQRNSLLKNWNFQPDEALLNVLDWQIAQPSIYLYQKRQSFLARFTPMVQEYYKRISGETYTPGIVYASPLHQETMEQLLEKNRQKDILQQRTVSGLHRDDLVLTLKDVAFKNIASQGQKKSLLFALKLAEYDFILQEKNRCFLLLDDVFEKLDEKRMHNLLSWVGKDAQGQVFITDTHKDRMAAGFEQAGMKAQIIEL